MFKKLLKENRPDLSRPLRRLIEREARHVGKDPSLEQITRGIQDDLDRLGVLSLSASDRNILLWSHYAMSHSGICLKFLAEENTPLFVGAQKVEYLTEYPQVHLHDDPDWHIKSFLLTKAHDWSYEQEWRIITTEGHGNKSFPDNLLTGVILGVRMLPEDRDYVVNLIKQRKSPVEICQANIKEGSFSLEFEALRL